MSQTPTNSTPAKTPATAAEKQLLWLVRDLVVQGCTDERFGQSLAFDGPTPVFSQFIAIYAQAIALLADYGLVTDLTDNGGRVVSGTLLSPVDTAKRLQTGMFDPRQEEMLETNAVPPSDQEVGRFVDAFFRPSPLLKQIRKGAK